jgi:hypothetical protein
VGDEMTLWVEEERLVAASSRKAKNSKSKTTSKTTINNTKSVGKMIGNVDDRNANAGESVENDKLIAENDTAKPVGVQLTERDLETIGWITDQYAVRTDVIRWLLGDGRPLSDSRTRAIVARWQRAGLAGSRRFFTGTPNVVWPTRAGTNLVRPGWRSRPPNLALLAHHHAVSRVRLAIEQRGHDVGWVCERTLYRQRTSPGAHVADGTFNSSQGPLTAVEVELTLKSTDRLRDIVRDLTLDYEAVLYVAGDAAIGRAVENAARSVGEGDRVRVVDLARVVIDDA